MKIKTRALSYDQVQALPRPAHQDPLRPHLFFRGLIRLLSIPALLKTQFTFTQEGWKRWGISPA